MTPKRTRANGRRISTQRKQSFQRWWLSHIDDDFVFEVAFIWQNPAENAPDASATLIVPEIL